MFKQRNNPFLNNVTTLQDSPLDHNCFKMLETSPVKQSNQRTKGKGRHFRSSEEGAGMTEAGVASYKKENPGSNLKTAVTEKNPSEKDAARRRSFCARSRGWTGERGRAARRRWRC